MTFQVTYFEVSVAPVTLHFVISCFLGFPIFATDASCALLVQSPNDLIYVVSSLMERSSDAPASILSHANQTEDKLVF